MRARSTWAALALFLLPAAAAVAQEQASGPPPVLVISQEEIKPGSMAAHEKISRWARQSMELLDGLQSSQLNDERRGDLLTVQTRIAGLLG